MLSKELLEILACPKCKGELIYEEKRNVLICPNCKVYYPIEDDIPILLIEYARPLDELGENQTDKGLQNESLMVKSTQRGSFP